MKVTLDAECAMSIIKSWCKRNVASEGLEVVKFEWKEGNLVIELKEEEIIDNDQEQ